MIDDTDTNKQWEQKSADILGKPAFEQRSRQVAARAIARRKAAAARRQGIRKRLVMRLLNRDRDKPRLHLVE